MAHAARPSSSDLGLHCVNAVYDQLKIDEKWTVWEERGFTWWGWRCSQRVWSEPAFDHEGRTVFRLHAQTDFLDGFEDTPLQHALVNMVGMAATLSGVIRDRSRRGRLRMASSVYADEKNLGWALRLFAMATITQAAESEIIGGGINHEGLRIAASAHPAHGQREEMDEMLDIFRTLIRPLGEGASAFIGPEFPDLLKAIDRPPCVLANGDETGLTAEYPFPGLTCLVQLSTDEKNPRAGAGLLARLTLPDGGLDPAGYRKAVELNETEVDSRNLLHFTGSWCVGEQGLTFVTFAPNILQAPGVTSQLGFNHALRALWVTDEVYGFDPGANYTQAIQRKAALMRRILNGSAPEGPDGPRGVDY